jgi:hypothetical protein
VNAYQVTATFPGCSYTDEQMEEIATATQAKHRASWMFSGDDNLTRVTLRVLADDGFTAVEAARRALKPTNKLLKADANEVTVVSEAEAYRRLLADETLPADLRKMAEAESV